MLIARGWDKPRVAQAVGWTVEILDEALEGRKPCSEMPPPCQCIVNGRRTCVCGANRNGKNGLPPRPSRFPPPDPKLLKKAKHLYEIKVMTVPEVAKKLGLSKGRTYLILIRAGTKFRRRGRRRREQ